MCRELSRFCQKSKFTRKSLLIQQALEDAKKTLLKTVQFGLPQSLRDSLEDSADPRSDLPGVLPLLEDHQNTLECLLRALTHQKVGMHEDADRLLTEEIEFLEILYNCEDIQEAQQAIRGEIKVYKKNIEEQYLKKIKIYDRYKKLWCDEKITQRAREHLSQKTWPEAGTSVREIMESECVMIEMASQSLEKIAAHPIKDGSGGVYIISHKGRPLFVFKPLEEAPGMPGNTKGQTPEKLQVIGDRSLDPDRLAFPISEGFKRECALSILDPNTKPRRTLTSLRLSPDSTHLTPGLLIEYVDHVFTVHDLADAAKQDHLKKESTATAAAQVDSFPKPLDDISEMKREKLAAQKRAVERCAEWQTVNPGMSKIHLLPFWNFVSKPSLERLVHYSLSKPNLDCNPQNLLGVEVISPVNEEDKQSKEGRIKPLYIVVPIDADQLFPDSWQKANRAAWVGSIACDFVLADSEFLCHAIKGYDATQMLKKLDDSGIHFQEEQKKFALNSQDVLNVGGEVYNILHAFHVVAKIGLANRNTANMGRLLYVNGSVHMRLYDLFIKAKLLGEKNSLQFSQEYLELRKTQDYQECFAQESVGDTKLWQNFENLILAELNKEKVKDSAQVRKPLVEK